MTTERDEKEKDAIARAAAQRLRDLNTPGAAQQCFDGYPAEDLSGPPDRSITNAEAPTELELGDTRKVPPSAIREGR